VFLTDSEILTLTNRKQPAAQVRMLRAMGIRHHVRDGRPVVTWTAVEGRREPQKAPINWEAVR
jgi:hypothetical protein